MTPPPEILRIVLVEVPMRAALGRFLLTGILAPVAVQAQSITPTRTAIRLYEQDGGFVLGAEKRVYTTYFNSLRTRYIAVEVSLDYPAAASGFQLTVGCQMTRPDGKIIDGIWKIGMPIRAGSTHSEDANIMFGAGKEGWQTGMSKVTCAASRALGEVSFQMSPGPSLLSDGEFRLKEVRFFPTSPKLISPADRKYQDRFSASEATHIGIELSFVHAGLAKGGAVPVDCYYLQGAGSVLGTMSAVYEFEASATGGAVAMGLGWDQPGHWPQGEYLAICQIHGRPIAVERFMVW
jgi:hypothetical protein